MPTIVFDVNFYFLKHLEEKAHLHFSSSDRSLLSVKNFAKKLPIFTIFTNKIMFIGIVIRVVLSVVLFEIKIVKFAFITTAVEILKYKRSFDEIVDNMSFGPPFKYSDMLDPEAMCRFLKGVYSLVMEIVKRGLRSIKTHQRRFSESISV